MKRRTFMYLSAVAAAMGLPSLYSFKRYETSNIALSQPEYLSHICNENKLMEIGNAYKAKFPSESNTDQLLMLLLTDNTGKRFSQTSDLSKIKLFIDQKIRQEIESCKTVVVNGWVVSVTEARQCALLTNQHVY